MADTLDLLRRAAKLLRERSGAATEGPWNADPAEVYGGAEATWVAESLNGDLDDGGEANSRYIALMHPPVAELVADLLEAQQPLFAGLAEDVYDEHPALRLARAVLREEYDRG